MPVLRGYTVALQQLTQPSDKHESARLNQTTTTTTGMHPEMMARVHGHLGSGVGLPTGTSATVVRHVRRRRRGGSVRRKQRGAAWEPEQTWFVVSVRAVKSRSCPVPRRVPAAFGGAIAPLLQLRLSNPSATIVCYAVQYERVISESIDDIPCSYQVWLPTM